jgi:hypothetical protein
MSGESSTEIHSTTTYTPVSLRVASRNAKQFHLLSLSTISRAPKMSCGACRAGKSWA